MYDLPKTLEKSEQSVVSFFDNYYKKTLEFAANDFDAVYGFFTKRGFDDVAARTVAQILLSQAKIENVKVFKLLDTLSGYNKTELSTLIIKIINASRDVTSRIGNKKQQTRNAFDIRNIIV